MNQTLAGLRDGVAVASANFITFLPKALLALVLLAAGYFLAKVLGKLTNRVLERVRFDDLVERGGVKKAMEATGWDVSDILAQLVFYVVMLFALQLAFGVFGPNPVSDLLTRVVAYLPNIFVAILIMVIAAAVATGVKKIVSVSLSSVSYGRTLASVAAGAVVVLGVFAALDELNIAPAIVNGMFLRLVGGSGRLRHCGDWRGRNCPHAPKMEQALQKTESEDAQIRSAPPTHDEAARRNAVRRTDHARRPAG
jgi:hypothetical protein